MLAMILANQVAKSCQSFYDHYRYRNKDGLSLLAYDYDWGIFDALSQEDSSWYNVRPMSHIVANGDLRASLTSYIATRRSVSYMLRAMMLLTMSLSFSYFARPCQHLHT